MVTASSTSHSLEKVMESGGIFLIEFCIVHWSLYSNQYYISMFKNTIIRKCFYTLLTN